TGDAMLLPVVNYVARTQAALVLHDAPADAAYGSDPYIARHRPRSVLCFPVLSQKVLRCILYCENTLTTGAFTEDRVEVLEMLSSRVAISLEKPRLSDGQKALLVLATARPQDLERAVELRTAELRAALDEVTKLSHSDPLTGLLNRRAFTERASNALA